MKPKAEIIIEKFILGLAGVIIVLSTFWYFGQVELAKDTAFEFFETIRDECSKVGTSVETCEIDSEIRRATQDIFCGKEMQTHMDQLMKKIENSHNYWFLQEQINIKPTRLDRLVTNPNYSTVGDMFIGIEYFTETSKLRLEKIKETNALGDPCQYNKEIMKKRAQCSSQSIKKFVPSKSNDLVEGFLDKANNRINQGLFVESLLYSTAAASFYDQTSRDLLSELVQADNSNTPICLDND